MVKKTTSVDLVAERLDNLLTAIQDLFILEGLHAGIGVEEVRQILRIDKRRINKISSPLKKAQRRAAKRAKADH